MDTKGMDSCFTIDRISNLPCNVIDHILKYMPLRDAVRTSILSRGWQNKWLSIPLLVFDWNFRNKLLEKHTIESVIYQILLLHKGSVVKFEYSANVLLSDTALYQWLHFLSNHRIEDLALRFPDSLDTPQMMPHHLFNFDQLKHLQLQCCNLKLPSAFKGFGRLVSLDLKYVLIVGGTNNFISKCSMLEHLNISSRSHLTFAFLKIDAPNLKSFVFLGKCLSFSFNNTSFLEKVSISLSQSSSTQGSEINSFEFLGQLSSIKELELHYVPLPLLLLPGGPPHKLPKDLIRLNVLRCIVNFVSVHEVACALCLIRSSPNLQLLEITSMTNHDDDAKPSIQFLTEQQKVKHSLSHLKSVKIDSFSASKPEMEFVKLVLSAATTLIKLELKLRHHLNHATEEGYLMFKRLARFPRASSKARIIT